MKYFLVLLFLSSLSAYCQKTITGQVLDFKNNAIGLATVELVGKNATCTTDDFGVFFLKLPSEIKKGDIIILRINKQGYKTSNRQISVSSLSFPIRLVKNKIYKGQPFSTSKLTVNSAIKREDSLIKPVVNVTSNFQSGGITANQVNIGAVPRKLDLNSETTLLSFLQNKEEKIDVTSVMGDAEAFQFANEITNFLKVTGYRKVNGGNQALYTMPIFGQNIGRDSTGVKIIIGSRR